MKLCLNCLMRGYCRRLFIAVTTDDELDNSDYIRDLRGFAHSLNFNDEDWHEFLTELYRDFPGWIMDEDGAEVFLNMEEFERPSIREWFRDFCCKEVPGHVIPHVRIEARERARILATILRASFPIETRLWGLRADNDNNPQ